MARPNNGKTKNSCVFSIRVDKDIFPEFKERAENIKTELFLRKNKELLGKSDAKNWHIKIIYDPKKSKKNKK